MGHVWDGATCRELVPIVGPVTFMQPARPAETTQVLSCLGQNLSNPPVPPLLPAAMLGTGEMQHCKRQRLKIQACMISQV